MATVNDVASFFIDWANKSEEEHMTNLWLNKLLYFAQGHFLATFGRPLFDEVIEAWDYGPVISCIYQKYKVCGRNPISVVDENYSIENLTREEQLFLADLLRKYGDYSAGALVSMTHQPYSPWRTAYETGRNTEISREEMMMFFLRPANKLKSFTELILTLDFPTIGKRDEDGFLVLPCDGDEEDDWDEL